MGRDAHTATMWKEAHRIHLLLFLAPGFTYGMLIGWLWAVSTSRNSSVLLPVGHCASSHVVHVCAVTNASTGMANPAKARVVLALALPGFLPLLLVAQFGKKACGCSSLLICVSVIPLSVPPSPPIPGCCVNFLSF